MKNNILEAIKRLKKEYPDAKVALSYSNPLEILVATILSAQCTDERVNIVTQALFKKYRKLDDYANADLKEFEQDIRSTGFYRHKAKNIINSAKLILKNFKGKVPDKMEEILTLPGVARKTANVVLGNAYGIIEGIVVDTHVIRLSQRLGFTKNEAPEKIEQDLMKIVPKKDWFAFSYLLQSHGRKICKARNPDCPGCFLNYLCPSSGKF
ncbi:MAG: endonuclease III [Elusimicrobia bacterium]|nr:endonuclease III [Candidatus Liberimonas magnetica]